MLSVKELKAYRATLITLLPFSLTACSKAQLFWSSLPSP